MNTKCAWKFAIVNLWTFSKISDIFFSKFSEKNLKKILRKSFTAISGSKELFPRSRYSPVWSEISSSNIRAFWNQNKVSWASWVERRTFNCNRNSKNARKFELCISDQTGEFLLCGKSSFDPDIPVIFVYKYTRKGPSDLC